MVGEASPKSLAIRSLTSPHDAVTSSRWRSRQTQFQQKLRRHPVVCSRPCNPSAGDSWCESSFGFDVYECLPGYDAKTNREAARKRGICPVIPYRSNTIGKPKFFAKILYKARVDKIKRFKRPARRRHYASFVALVCGFILIKSVHTA
jgi:hypothetical protein